ncbi:MAG: hypothetical protein ABI275_00985 [Terrimesophilobacter sp.]
MKNMKSDPPDLMPVLSRGKHRTARSGGCFMEFASYLAGESWSDHPSCTHPLLASLARMVNDCSSDYARSRLVKLIPDVIGLTSSDPRKGIMVALRAAASALPVVAAERQRALAVGILACERALSELDGAVNPFARTLIDSAFRAAPDTERWAREFVSSIGSWARTGFTSRTADAIVLLAVQGIARACVSNADERLHDLLVAAIHDFATDEFETTPGAPTPSTTARTPIPVTA